MAPLEVSLRRKDDEIVLFYLVCQTLRCLRYGCDEEYGVMRNVLGVAQEVREAKLFTGSVGDRSRK